MPSRISDKDLADLEAVVVAQSDWVQADAYRTILELRDLRVAFENMCNAALSMGSDLAKRNQTIADLQDVNTDLRERFNAAVLENNELKKNNPGAKR